MSACMVLGWWIARKTTPVPPVEHITDTVTITDTITHIQPQYIKLNHYDTVELPVIYKDTVTDTFLVEIPISAYRFDTVLADTSHTTRFSASLTGFNVTLDTLSISTEIIQREPRKATRKWYQRIVPAAGVGVGPKGWGVFAGIGFNIF